MIGARRASVIAVVWTALAVSGSVAVAGEDDDLLEHHLIFARDASLWRTDARGKGPATEVATLPSAASDVRALRTDAAGTVLLADVAGSWYWMPLDGSTTTLTAIACKGAATLAPDGSCAICAGAKDQVAIVHLATGKVFPLAVPAAGAAIVGTGKDRKVIWSAGGIWSAPVAKLSAKTAVAPESPLRSLSIAPDGSRALGVYPGEIHEGRTTKPAELLFEFALDGTAARRKSIRTGVPVIWSHDSQWVLIQDGASACVARGVGGQYKCWKGFTAVSIAPDGSYALVLGQRKDRNEGKGDGKAKGDKGKGKGDKSKSDKGKAGKGDKTGKGDKDEGDKDKDGGEDGEDAGEDATAAVATGSLSLYRARLSGAYTDPPALVERIVDGAAVWLP